MPDALTLEHIRAASQNFAKFAALGSTAGEDAARHLEQLLALGERERRW